MSIPSRKASKSLVVALTCWFSVVTSLLVISTTVTIYLQMRSHLIDGDRVMIKDKLQEYREFLTEGSTEKPISQEVAEEANSDSWMNTYVRILDESGATLMATEGFPEFTEQSSTVDGKVAFRLIRTAGGENCSIGSITVEIAGGASRQVEVIMVNPKTEDVLRHYRAFSAVAVALSMLVSALCGYVFAKRGTTSVTTLGRIIAAIGSGHLTERIPMDGLPREIAILAERFNSMLERLEESFMRLDRFSADIAHELRTPVNNLRIITELALTKHGIDTPGGEAFVSTLEECRRLEKLINALLLLARVENPEIQLVTELLDLNRELQVVTAFYEVSASDRGIAINCTSVTASFFGDRILFQRLIGNLLENALAHTPAGGSICIDGSVNKGRIIIRITDSGDGIPADQLALVFDRFRRVGRELSGRVGLGLPIVRGIARVHGGEVHLHSKSGAGTTAEINLPLLTKM